MTQTSSDRARELARNLVEMLTSYEEELMMLEIDAPAISQLRRAVSIAIAEACYWISDEGGVDEWATSADNTARRPN